MNPEKTAPDSPSAPGSGPQILVVDDDPNFSLMLQDLLVDQGYRAEVRSDGPSCLEYCQDHTPDLILLDVRMPGMNGFNVCARLKAEPQTAAIPIMLLTGLSEPENKIRGFSLGIFHYLTKPFKNEELLARIANILGRQNFLRQTVEESKVTTVRQLSVSLADRITNPLSGIMACCQLLSKNIQHPEKVIEIVEKIKEAVDEIYAALLKLTTAERIESARYSQDIEMIDLEKLSGEEKKKE